MAAKSTAMATSARRSERGAGLVSIREKGVEREVREGGERRVLLMQQGGPGDVEGSREQHGGIGDMATVASLSPQGR